MTYPVWCPRCLTAVPHSVGEGLLTCTVCASVRLDDALLLCLLVQALESAISCPTAAGHPCGVCPSCLASQLVDLVLHGSPSDLEGGL